MFAAAKVMQGAGSLDPSESNVRLTICDFSEESSSKLYRNAPRAKGDLECMPVDIVKRLPDVALAKKEGKRPFVGLLK